MELQEKQRHNLSFIHDFYAEMLTGQGIADIVRRELINRQERNNRGTSTELREKAEKYLTDFLNEAMPVVTLQRVKATVSAEDESFRGGHTSYRVGFYRQTDTEATLHTIEAGQVSDANGEFMPTAEVLSAGEISAVRVMADSLIFLRQLNLPQFYLHNMSGSLLNITPKRIDK